MAQTRYAVKNSNPFKFLSIANATTLVEKLARDMKDHKWNPRIEMAMHGEPTMNPDYHDIVYLLENIFLELIYK